MKGPDAIFGSIKYYLSRLDIAKSDKILFVETRHCTGVTENLEARLKAHNNSQDPHTAKYRPWRIETAIAFRSREKANHWTSTKLRLPLNASFRR